MLSLASYGGLKLYMWNKAKHEVDQVFNEINHAMSAAYDLNVVAAYKQISTSVFGPIGIKGVSLRIPEFNEEVTVAELKLLEHDLDIDSKKGNLPLRIHLLIDGLRINVSLLEKMGKQFNKLKLQHDIKDDPTALVNRLGYQEIVRRSNDLLALGYSQLDMDLEYNMTINLNSKEASLFFRQNTKSLGNFKIKLNIVEMSDNINSAVLGARIKEARFEYVDKSYMDRFIKSYADDVNMTLPAFREKLVRDIKEDFADKNIKLGDRSVKNIQTFVKKPEKIVFTIYPYRPIGIESLKHYKVGDIPSLLNLQAHLE